MFFSKPIVDCSTCGKEIGSKEKRWSIKDGYICADCQEPFGLLNGPRAFVDYDKEQLTSILKIRREQNDLLRKNKETFESLIVTKVIENVIHIDEGNMKWYYKPTKVSFQFYLNPDEEFPIVFDYNDIVEIYIAKGDKIINETSVTKKNKGIAKAAFGALIAGSTGAIVGSVLAGSKTNTVFKDTQTFYVNVIINGADEPLSLPFSNEQSAEKVRHILLSMIEKTGEIDTKTESSKAPIYVADEIRKFKQLLDDGIITPEEFDAKKKKLLDI